MLSFFYRGKHRKPTTTKRNVAVLGAGAGLTLSPLSIGTAAADPPGGWGAIIQCESGGKNINNSTFPKSTASGYYQIINGTWKAFGGLEFAPRAINASFAEQTIVANRIFAANPSLSDWNASRSCWGSKIGKVPVKIDSQNAPRELKKKLAPKQNETPQVKPNSNLTCDHRVVSGDTLSGISGANWPKTFEANREVIGDNPNLIFPGQCLDLPEV